MEYDDDGLGGGGADDNVRLGMVCEVCGATDFISEAGFYYCQACNTQSQEAREYVDEEFVPSRTTNLRQSTALSKDRTSTEGGNSGSERIWLSSWEFYNKILELMTSALIKAGFPETLRDKVFQLWTTYLLRRKAISRTQAGKPKLTLGEPANNYYALYNIKKNFGTRKSLKRNASSLDDDIANYSTSQAKAKRTRNRMKAFEKEYLEHASQMSGHDATYDNVGGSTRVHASSAALEVPAINSRHFTDTSRKLRKALRSKRRGLSMGQGVGPEFYKINKISEVERFNLMSVLILLFIAARQIGCTVIFSDFIRLFNDGTLYVETVKNAFSDECDDPFGLYQGFYGPWNTVVLNPAIADTIESYITYLGIRNFQYPSVKEILPKISCDFVFPRELESLLAELSATITLEEVVKDLGPVAGSLDKLEILVELWILIVMTIGLKMLFGLDDITEKHQSRFARTVNKIIVARLTRPKVTFEETELIESSKWVELFVLEDWLTYMRCREDVLTRELYNKESYHPQSTMNIRKLDDFIQSFCDYKVTMDFVSRQPQRTGCINLVDSFKGLATRGEEEIPELPTYISMPLPRESVIDHYAHSFPNVAYPERSEILTWNFRNRRIDFIWNPQKYIPLLNKSGYKVKVIPGDAINHKRRIRLREKTLVLFQPYKKFDDDFASGNSSASLQYIIKMCYDLLSGKNNFNEDSNTYFRTMCAQVANMYARRGSTTSIPMKEPLLFTVVDSAV